MQIVIDIPEEMYNRIKDGYVPLGLSKYLKNGTLLPKGHGRLIDADAVDTRYSDPEVVETLDNAPTIIEANKTERGEAE